MKTKVVNYTFDASDKTVTLTDYSGATLDQILLITNVTDGIVIYSFASPTLGGTIAGGVITLEYDTTSMSDSDSLQIFIEDNLSVATQTTLAALLAKVIAAPSTEAKQDILITGLSNLLTELQLKADLTDTQPVSLSSIPLPNGASESGKQDIEIGQLQQIVDKLIAAPATEADQDIGNTSLSNIDASLTKQEALPLDSDLFFPVRQLPQVKKRYGFEDAVVNDVQSDLSLLLTGAGMTVNQTGGSLLITAGTTARAETIIRSIDSWNDAMTMRYSAILSQRIVNNNFYIELVDVIGDGLAYSIGSATAITVTIPSNPFTSENVGQSITIGALVGTGTFLSGNYPIASVSGNDVTFTVSGFAVGTGTCSLFGWSYHHVLYNGTTATANLFGNQRNGYSTADITTVINTTASPGHVGTINAEDGVSAYCDQLSASSTTTQLAVRAQNVRNVPEADTVLYLQIRVLNGTTNPASGTTLTLGFVDIENYTPQHVSITAIRPQSFNHSLPVAVNNTPAVTITSGTVTTVSTVTAVTTVTTIANGQTAHSAASTGNPFRIGGRVKTTNETTLASGEASNFAATTDEAMVCKPYAVPELDWSYVAGAGGISNTTTAVTIKAAVSNIRNYITSMQISSEALGAATELAIRDGAAGTVIWRMKIGTAGIINGLQIDFTSPIKSTANTLLEVVTLTASITGAVFINVQGYQAP